MPRPRPWHLTIAAAAALASAFAGLSLSPVGASSTNVNVVGYSVVGPAFKALETAFQKTTAGKSVTFTNSFGASDTQASNVAAGQPADLVNFSYEPNMASLVTAGKVPSTWASQELSVGGVNVGGTTPQTVYSTPGILTDSVVVMVVRKGNPLHITNWSSVVAKGVSIVTPNPMTSGSAKWNLLAAYSSQLSLKRTPDQAQIFLKQVIQHTIAQPVSGSASLATFLAGTGSVLLSYEDDAIAAVAAGKAVQIVTPPQTLLIENPVALTKTGVSNPGARAFYKYVFSTAGQTILANLGFRSVLKTVWNATKAHFTVFTNHTNLLRIYAISNKGWPFVDPEFFSPTVKWGNGNVYPTQGIVTYYEQFAGQSS